MSDESIFAAALGISDLDARQRFLDEECENNPQLRREVDALLAAHVSGNLLDQPVIDFGPTGLFQEQDSGPPPAEVGDHIGPYRLMEQIGEGGFGLVFVAEQQEPVQRKVAIKVLKPGMDTREVIARFEAERQALALMDHPNIAKVLDAGSTDSGRPYFVMELVRGIPITEYCDQQKLAPQDRLELFAIVCQAVQHAHHKGIIHRDIKPTNVLVTTIDGKPVPKVIDFGVAKAVGQKLTEKTLYTKFAQMVGTPLYMSPEQAQMSGVDVDTRTDIYALGVLLYELLTGTTPFDRERFRTAAFDEIRRIIREEDPPRPSMRLTSLGETLPSVSANRKTEPARLPGLVRGELDWIVMKALDKERNRRYETANALARDVERFLNQEAVEACPPTLGYRLRKTCRKHQASILTGGAFLALLLVGLFLTTHFAINNRKLAKIAQELALESQLNAVRAQENAENEAEQRELAEQQAAAAKAVSDFLFEEMISAVDPNEQPNVDITLREVIDQAKDRLEDRFENTPEVAAAIKLRLGQAYNHLKIYVVARELLRDAYEIRSDLFGQEHPETLAVQEELFESMRNGPNSLEVVESLYEFRKKNDPDEKLAETLRAHRLLVHKQAKDLAWQPNQADAAKQWSEIEHQYMQILKKQREVLGNDHVDVLRTMQAIATGLYGPQRRYEDFLDICRQRLDLSRRLHGHKDHPDTYYATLGIVTASYHLGRYDEVERHVPEALAIGRRLWPANRDTNRALREFLLYSYLKSNRFEQGLADFKDFVTEHGQENARMHLQLALLYRKYGDNEACEACVTQLLSQFRNTRDPRNAGNAAIAYLIFPDHHLSQQDKLDSLNLAVDLARLASEPTEDSIFYPSVALCRVIAEYRLGNYRESMDWLTHRAIQKRQVERATGIVFQAMNQFQIGNVTEAATLLESSKAEIGQYDPGPGTFEDMMIAQLALKEAIALIEGESQQDEISSP